MTAKIFIDGEVGTTGLQIRERLEGRPDLEFIRLGEAERKDKGARKEALNAAVVAILCLPDDAAREAVSLINNPDTVVIDASTAHRVADGWTYGFPELCRGQREAIRASKRIANTGCYAVASVALLRPLVDAGLLPAGYPITINAVSGYTGGGKGLIKRFEDPSAEDAIDAAHRVYALGLAHKHLPEITQYGRLEHPPLFLPSVGRFAQGMLVHIPLQLWSLPGKPAPEALHAALAAHYAGEAFVRVIPYDEGRSLAHLEPEELNGSNGLELFVLANPEAGQAVLTARLDNLGKGASGQAVQLLNLVLGSDETEGLKAA